MQNGELVADPRRIHLKSGFEPGAFYRFVYRTRDPFVAGAGLAAVRDLMSWVRHDPAAIVHATRNYAFGISQSGRFLRQFLNEGFNADLAGRAVFDGMMVHIAGGGRRGFNERFAQPSRNLVSRVFPFSDIAQTDPETGETGGLLDSATAANVVPKILYTHSSWEYWGSGASAMHTTIGGDGDVRIPGTSRVYYFAGTQHVPVAFPPRAAAGQLPPNPMDYRPGVRALYVALDRWVRDGVEPPASRYPLLAQRNLVDRDELNVKGLRAFPCPLRCNARYASISGRRPLVSRPLCRPRPASPIRCSFHKSTMTATRPLAFECLNSRCRLPHMPDGTCVRHRSAHRPI